MKHEELMREAIALARQSVENNWGGPFGAVIAREGRLIARGCNRVLSNSDPTAHAEVVAIRAACAAFGAFDLSGCTLYSSCEPCPMCLGAIYWARIDTVFYANTREDAARIGFIDADLYREMGLSGEERKIPMFPLLRAEAQEGLRLWMDKGDRVQY